MRVADIESNILPSIENVVRIGQLVELKKNNGGLIVIVHSKKIWSYGDNSSIVKSIIVTETG